MPTTTHRCGKCKRDLPAKDFAPSHRANGYYCRECDAEYQRQRTELGQAARQPAYCKHCGKKLPANRASQRRFCDLDCRDAARSVRRYGERVAYPYPELRDPKWLRARYVDDRLTQREIAALLGCAKNTVAQAMKAAGIEPRREHTGVCGCCGLAFTTKSAKPALYCSDACQLRARALRNVYRLSIDDFRSLLRAQDYRCAICGAEERPGGRALAIDHCHGSGVVRGLLCSLCNTGLGQFKDRPDLLRAAIAYLEKGPA